MVQVKTFPMWKLNMKMRLKMLSWLLLVEVQAGKAGSTHLTAAAGATGYFVYDGWRSKLLIMLGIRAHANMREDDARCIINMINGRSRNQIFLVYHL